MNTIETCPKVYPVFGWSPALSRIRQKKTFVYIVICLFMF